LPPELAIGVPNSKRNLENLEKFLTAISSIEIKSLRLRPLSFPLKERLGLEGIEDGIQNTPYSMKYNST
jgi:hypothetical protein